MYSRRPIVRRSPVRRGFAPVTGRPLGPLSDMFPAYAPAILWVLTGTIVALVGLRFGMRFIGVRGDVPVPGAIYAITAPLVERFYGAFPASARFDYPYVETASLAAAGAVIGAAVVIYALGLVVSAFLGWRRGEDDLAS